jgi:hypothetical protein
MTTKLKLEDLKNKHRQAECVILTCGPSLVEYPREKVLEFIKGKTVICIKEAIIEYKEEADYFIDNSCRTRKFDIPDKTIKIHQSKGEKLLMDYDLLIHEARPYSEKTQLLRIKNYDDYNMEKNPLRQWGPGILFETVFYLCKYMGFKNVYTIGWDLIDLKNTFKMTHYFDDNKTDEYKSSQRWGNQNYHAETRVVDAGLPSFYDYFKDLGMNIIVVGEQSFVNRYIPRIKL